MCGSKALWAFKYSVLVKILLLLYYMHSLLSSFVITIDLEFDKGYEVTSFGITFITFASCYSSGWASSRS